MHRVIKKHSNKLREYAKKPHAKAAGYVFIIFVATLIYIVLVQLLWPANRSILFVKTPSGTLNFASQQDVRQSLQPLSDDAKIKVMLGEKVFEDSFRNIGITANVEQTAEQIIDYPLHKRLIPGSVFGFWNTPKVAQKVDQKNLEFIANEWSKQVYSAPTNATLKLNGAEVVVESEKSGTAYEVSDIVAAVEQLPLTKGTQQVVVPSSEVEALRKSADLKDLQSQTQSAIEMPLKLIILDREVEVNKEQIASWLGFKELADNKLELVVDEKKLAEFLKPYQERIYISPGTTIISLRDDQEVERETGKSGRGLDIPANSEAIKTHLAGPHMVPLKLDIKTLKPKIVYERSYTTTNRGLEVFIKDLAKSKGDYAISVKELNGKNRSADFQGDKLYHPASTYKLFVAYSVLKRIEDGRLKWGQKYLDGLTVQQCFDEMIIRSNNPCAEKFGSDFTWKTIENELRAIGITSTLLNSGGGFKSTTNDQVKFLNKLMYGNILNTSSKNKLLQTMNDQVYRQGIPAGVGGVVKDKVGFWNGYLHDSAVVQKNGRIYLLSIYTSGSSWGDIADTANKIDEFLVR
jgi:beta-lactamase class A